MGEKDCSKSVGLSKIIIGLLKKSALLKNVKSERILVKRTI